MAKLRIVGMPEPIDIDDRKAKEFTDGRRSGVIGNDDYISIGSWYGKARDVRGVWIPPAIDLDPHGEMLERMQNSYVQERRRLQDLSPKERANKTTRGYFGLLYWGVNKVDAPKDVESRAIELAIGFYEGHPYWTVPSISCWEEFFKGRSMNAFAFSISERVESSQAQMSTVDERSVKIK